MANPKRHVCKRVGSPVGTLTLVANDDGLAGILWENDRPGRVRLNIEAEDNRHPVLIETERQLEEYFAGRRKEFAVKVDLTVSRLPFRLGRTTRMAALPCTHPSASPVPRSAPRVVTAVARTSPATPRRA